MKATIDEYVALSDKIKELQAQQSFLKEKLLAGISDDCESIESDNYHITTTWTKGSPGKVITQEMVGEVINARKPYRQFRVKAL